jgi:MerR family redox-sensitive transcriptional activator SoxR
VAGWTISEVSNQAGLAPSAVRYYERIGLLPKAHLVGGQRRYDFTVLNQLAVLQRARRLGFTLDEIRQLFCSFPQWTRASERWQKCAQAKLTQLDKLAEEIDQMRRLLRRIAGSVAVRPSISAVQEFVTTTVLRIRVSCLQESLDPIRNHSLNGSDPRRERVDAKQSAALFRCFSKSAKSPMRSSRM